MERWADMIQCRNVLDKLADLRRLGKVDLHDFCVWVLSRQTLLRGVRVHGETEMVCWIVVEMRDEAAIALEMWRRFRELAY